MRTSRKSGITLKQHHWYSALFVALLVLVGLIVMGTSVQAQENDNITIGVLLITPIPPTDTPTLIPPTDTPTLIPPTDTPTLIPPAVKAAASAIGSKHIISTPGPVRIKSAHHSRTSLRMHSRGRPCCKYSSKEVGR